MNTKLGLGIATAFATLFLCVGQAVAVDPVINACVDNNGGIRILQVNQYGFPPNPCQSYERPITLQPSGPAAISGWEQLTNGFDVSCNNAGFCNVELSCSPGKRLLGGGAQTFTGGSPPGVTTVISASFAKNDRTWFAQALTIPFTPLGRIGAQITIQCANAQ